MDAPSQLIKALAFLIPVALPLLVFSTSAKLGFWWRTVLVATFTVASLPVSFVLILLANDRSLLSHDDANPGIGVVAIPVMIEWAIVFLTVISTITFLIVKKIYSKWKR
jgi:hypothetical protein